MRVSIDILSGYTEVSRL